jgi:hypothetical protein
VGKKDPISHLVVDPTSPTLAVLLGKIVVQLYNVLTIAMWDNIDLVVVVLPWENALHAQTHLL